MLVICGFQGHLRTPGRDPNPNRNSQNPEL